ncbi:MAG: XTP/dITP diphosphatase [Ignavibacteriales bacterium]
MEVIFASQNKGKIKEVKKIFEDSSIKIISLDELGFSKDIEETGKTFEENAFIKAKELYEEFKKPVIADDSGLMVEQLNGEPGVYSARYAGENCNYDDNNLKLLKELANYSKPHRAKFVCCAVYFDSLKQISEFGFLEGEIIDEARGKNGFGYDPIFVPNNLNDNKTLAELTLEEKTKISHRKKAFEKLKIHLMKELIESNQISS